MKLVVRNDGEGWEYVGPFRQRRCPHCDTTIDFAEWSRSVHSPFMKVFWPAMRCDGCERNVIWEDAK
jgi:hypothetical protein